MALTPLGRKTTGHLVARLSLLAALLLCLSLTARAQESPLGIPPEIVPPTVRQGPLFWADGITKINDLDAYKAMGFNVVVVRLTWTATAGGEISARNLAPQRAFAEAAAKRGLQIIYALPAAPTGLEGSFRLAADSDAYVSLWTTWLQDAVAALRGTPNLLGWMLPDDPRSLPLFDDMGFKRWISQNYASSEVINRQWSASFESMDDINLADVTQLIANWGVPAPITDEERASGSTTLDRRGAGPNGSFHPAALAIASYKWDAYRALLTTWIGAVRGEDSTHLVFSGRTPDYAQLLSMPSGIDVVVPDVSPGVAENDIVTHNPQALDIARRSGKFGVWPVLSPRPAADLPASALPDLTRRWMAAACAHGAKGLGFDDWNNVSELPGLSKAISEELNKLSKPPYSRLWGQTPVNTTAVLLTPLADGVTLQYGTPPNQNPRGLYGFGEGLVADEPSSLVWMLRWGTVFGGIDYLSPDDLSETQLDRYTTILAPQTLSATNETSAQLTDYVANGGVLVADLGIGALQNGGQVNALTPPLATLFGVPGVFDVRPIPFNLVGVAPHPLFPSWSSQINTRPGLSLTLGDGPNGAAFSGPVGLSLTPPNVPIVASGPRIGQEYGPINRVLSAGLTVSGVGRGYAVFAPFRLWSSWRPGQTGFDNFFGDLMSRGATVALPGITSLVPSPVNAKIGTTFFPEVINHPTSLTLSNHSAPGESLQLAGVQTSGTGDWLWSGALAHLTAEGNFPIVGGRGAPIENPSEFEARQRPVSLYATIPPGEANVIAMRPIAAQNLAGGTMAAAITLESARRLKVNLWPNSPTIVASNDEWQPTLAEAAPVRMTVVHSEDGYNALPGSRHRVQITDYGKVSGKNKFTTTERIVVTNDEGRFSFEFSGIACAVDIIPVA